MKKLLEEIRKAMAESAMDLFRRKYMRRQVHELKCHPMMFEAVARNDKTFDFRKNDRNFEEGDLIILKEFTEMEGEGGGTYTGREIGPLLITYVLEGPSFGVPSGYCVFSFLKYMSTPKT